MGKFKTFLEEYKTMVTLVLVVVIIGGIFLATKISKVTVQENKLNVSGVYGMSIPVNKIKDISLKDTLPEDLHRNNGIDFFGMSYIGNFESKELGKIKMYAYSKEKPYLYVALDNSDYNYMIIVLKDNKQTHELYENLIKAKK